MDVCGWCGVCVRQLEVYGIRGALGIKGEVLEWCSKALNRGCVRDFTHNAQQAPISSYSALYT